jgi:hypothetical protein
MSRTDRPGTPPPSRSSAKRVFHHGDHAGGHVGVEERRLLATGDLDHLEGEGHVRALVAEHPVGAAGEAVQQASRAQEVHVGEGGEEEQALDAGRVADEVLHEGAAVIDRLQPVQLVDRVHPLEGELRLGGDRRDVLHRVEGLGARLRLGHVGVEQGQVELHVQRLFVELARQVQARLGRVDVLVEVDGQVVGHDRVTGGEEGHQPLDEVALRRRHLLLQIAGVGREVDLFHGPGVLDGGPVHLVERRVAHRTQGQGHSGIEQHDLASFYWQASQVSGFSSEQATAAESLASPETGGFTVVLAMRVAGRERR